MVREDRGYQSQVAMELPEETASLYEISRVAFGTGVRYKTLGAGTSKVEIQFDAGRMEILEASGVRMLFFTIEVRLAGSLQVKALSVKWLHIDDLPRLQPASTLKKPGEQKPKKKPEYRERKPLSMSDNP